MTKLEFNTVIKDHTDALRTHALRFSCNEDDAADLVQETMVKAIRFCESFQDGTNLRGWLFTILKNTFLNTCVRNKKKKNFVVQDEEISSEQLCYSATSNFAEGNFVMKDIQKALSKVPEVYRIPFIRYFEGYKYQEIADYTGIPLGTIKTRIHFAREMLKKFLKTYKSYQGKPLSY
nr:RNA polymerase sigma factor [Pedobacter sp. ASV2]